MKARNPKVVILSVVGAGLLAVTFAILIILFMTQRPAVVDTATHINAEAATLGPLEVGSVSQTAEAEQLLYLIEEEKLAHDIYTKMHELYGANVFGNILQSESTHQSKVLALLKARGIEDPRSSEVGVFHSAELQALYNQLIEQGRQSAVEAYKVGVAIEEKDINDIDAQLATASDNDVITTLEALRRGSENHLRAFNRQL